jgi:tetratricopeptide (TPR) repeat protein
VSRALEWWLAHAGERRFLWVHLFDPHAPYLAPEPFASRFRQSAYAGEVAATDAYLEPLLGPFLQGRESPTLIVFTADHGEALGDHGELTHGLFAYQATLKTPLLLWGPGVGPESDSRLAGHVDIVPTVLEVLDLEVPQTLPGRSLLKPAADDRQLYFEALSTYFNRGWAPLRGVIAGSTKAIFLPLPELYDLAADPGEQHNLAGGERQRLRALLAGLPRERLASRPRQVSSEEIEKLRSLGYLSGTAAAKKSFSPDDDPKRLVTLDRKMHRFIDAYSRGDLALAEKLARETVAERSQMAMGYEHLALTLRRQERPLAALAVLRQAVGQGVESTSLLRQLGLTLSEVGRAREAVEVLEPLAADDDPATLNALGVGLTEAGRQREAIAVLERVLSIAPADVKAHETLGAVYLRLERAAEARRYLERAVELNENLPVSWNSLGVARSWLGDDNGALTAWERAIELDPRQFDALYNVGLTAAKVGRLDTARRALERFVATAPPRRFASDIVKARRLLEDLGP